MWAAKEPVEAVAWAPNPREWTEPRAQGGVQSPPPSSWAGVTEDEASLLRSWLALETAPQQLGRCLRLPSPASCVLLDIQCAVCSGLVLSPNIVCSFPEPVNDTSFGKWLT